MDKFIVSARKYRPVTFESVVGQSHITSTLKNAITNNQLAHAYLFCGPRGVGKTTCARILAKSINCFTPTANAEPCGVCESCQSFNDSRSFNIHELDAASNNSVNDIRSLTEQVRIPPQVGKYSIYIIDEAHMLSTSAFNAFLKTLEEPPAHAIFILATTEKHKLIPTILSRCQIYDFKRIKSVGLVDYLKFISSKESVTYDDESLHIIAEKADGCMRDALSMYDKVVSFCGSNLSFKHTAEALNVLDYDTYFNFVNQIGSGDYESALLLFDEVLQKGFDTSIFLNGMASHVRNLLVSKSDRTLTLLEVTGSVSQRFKEQAAKCSVNFLFDSLSIISQSEFSAKQSASQRLHAEIVILKLCNLSPIKLSGGSLENNYTLPQIAPQQAQPTAQKVQAQAPQAQVAPSVQPNVVAPSVVAVQPSVAPMPTTTQSQQTQQAPSQPTISQSAPTPALKASQPSTPPQPAVQKAATTRSPLKKSILDISLKSISTENRDVKKKEVKEVVVNVDITDKDTIAKILSVTKEYAKDLVNTRPRIATLFENAVVENGKIHLKVANDIAKDEILIDKHSFLNEIVSRSGIKGIDLEIEVLELHEQKQLLPIRSEDKLKYLIEQNSEIISLCKNLELDIS